MTRGNRGFLTAITSGAAAAVVLLTVGPAQASSQAPGSSPCSGSGYCLDFAGYKVAETVTSATATFTIPKLTCSAANQALKQEVSIIGNNAVTGSITEGCGSTSKGSSWAPNVRAGFFANGQSAFGPYPVATGDKVTISVTASSSSTSVTIHDLSNGEPAQTVSGSGMKGTVVKIGQVGVKAPNGGYQVPGPVGAVISFSGCGVNGGSLGSQHGLTRLQMASASTVQITTSTLSSDAFSNTIKAH